MAFAPSATAATVAGNTQALCVVADWTGDTTFMQSNLRPVANIEPSLAPGCSFFCKFAAVSATKRVYGMLIEKSGSASFTNLVNGIGDGGCMLAELDFGSRQRWLPAQHHGSLYLGGALLSVYDGEAVTEAGFISRPTQPSTSTAGGSLSPTVGYRYVAVYESVDASGNVIVSGISDPTGIIKPSAEDVTLSTTPCTVSSRNRRVAFYRTDDGGEPPYYRLFAVADDGTTSTVSGIDTVVDVTSNPKLYAPNLTSTPGESLDRRAPPGLVYLTSYNGMLVGAKRSSVFYSGQEVYGEATWFSPLFEVPIPGGGDVTGVCAQDGTLYVFKRDRIFSLSGDAPSDNGLQGGLGTPRMLACDVGCIDANSIVVTALGIFFQSERGIEVLNRGGGVEWVGDQIQRTLASYPIVTAAVLDERNSLVRFSLATSDTAGVATGDGRDLVYDLRLRQWQSVDDKVGAGAHEASQSADYVYLDGGWRYAWLGTNGTIYYERDEDNGSAYLDGSTWITMAAELAWLKLAGIQGKHHVNKALLLARKSTRADLNTYLSYDFATASKTVMTRAANDIDSLSTAIDRIQVEHQLHDEAEGQAFKVKFEDATPTGGTVGNGKGATWIAVTFEGVPRQGAIGVPEMGM
jgi:hypothetical protein